MNWIYHNNTDSPVIYRSEMWLPDETCEVAFPVPDSLGLTCVQEGSSPDPVLFHEDITIQPHSQEVVNISPPTLSHNVALSIQDMTTDSGCECRFNHDSNNAIPIDARSFYHVLAWENCSRLFLYNSTDNEAVISVTAIEVVS